LTEQPGGYGKEVLDRLLANRKFTREDYIEANRSKALLTAGVSAAMLQYDVLVGPTMPIAAPAFGQETQVIGASSYPLTQLFAIFTRLHSLTGFPAISVPCGRCRDGMPVGLQIPVARTPTRPFFVAQAYQQGYTRRHARPQLRGVSTALDFDRDRCAD
jgi:Asp-tRNA(Asn)/Glu-tRNA(Gln) amidotransferase A subunit family amidase